MKAKIIMKANQSSKVPLLKMLHPGVLFQRAWQSVPGGWQDLIALQTKDIMNEEVVRTVRTARQLAESNNLKGSSKKDYRKKQSF